MPSPTAHITKPLAFSAISSVTLERLHLLDKPPADGRANCLHVSREAPPWEPSRARAALGTKTPPFTKFSTPASMPSLVPTANLIAARVPYPVGVTQFSPGQASRRRRKRRPGNPAPKRRPGYPAPKRRPGYANTHREHAALGTTRLPANTARQPALGPRRVAPTPVRLAPPCAPGPADLRSVP